MSTRLIVFLLAAAGCLAGCSKGCVSPSPLEAENQKGVLRVQLHAEPVSLDPALVEDGLGLQLVTQLREGLVGYDGRGSLRNCLAASYTISADGKRFEFRLKPNLSWSDGEPVSIQDFVFGLRRSLNSETGGKIDQPLLAIRGAREYMKHPDDKKLGVFEENGKLVIELEQPTPYFIQALALPGALPVRRDALLESGGKWVEEKEPGTGPYRFAAYQQGRRLLLETNPYYWNGKPQFGLLDFLFVPDESTALNLFEAGKLDIVTRVPAPDVPRLRPTGALRTNPWLATYYVAFNTREAPFNDRDFRRAVAGVIRRGDIAESLGTGERPAKSWIPFGLEGYIPYSDPAPEFADSVKRVRARLSAHPIGDVRAGFDSSERNSTIMQKVQQDVLQGLGLHLALFNMDWKSYIENLRSDPPPIYRFAWLAPFSDSITHLSIFTSHDPNNYTGWSNAQYDQLVDAISRIPPGRAREAKIREAEALLVDREAVVVPIYHYVQNHLVAKRVGGFIVNPYGVIPFHDLTLNESTK